MKTTKIGKHEIVYFEGVDEMPTERWHKFNKFLMLKSGIGDTLTDVRRKIADVMTLIDNDPKKAKVELENMHMAVTFIDNCTDLNGFAFCVLIAKIDGVECNDLSDEGINKIYETVAKFQPSRIDALIQAVKKKLTESWTHTIRKLGGRRQTHRR